MGIMGIVESSKSTNNASAEVSLGKFAGCADMKTRSYLSDNDAVFISNSPKLNLCGLKKVAMGVRNIYFKQKTGIPLNLCLSK